jgi:hypothetical protein
MDSILEREGECRNSQATLRCVEVEVKARPLLALLVYIR